MSLPGCGNLVRLLIWFTSLAPCNVTELFHHSVGFRISGLGTRWRNSFIYLRWTGCHCTEVIYFGCWLDNRNFLLRQFDRRSVEWREKKKLRKILLFSATILHVQLNWRYNFLCWQCVLLGMTECDRNIFYWHHLAIDIKNVFELRRGAERAYFLFEGESKEICTDFQICPDFLRFPWSSLKIWET